MPKDEKSRFGLWWEHSPPPPPPQDWQSAAAYLRALDPNPPALVTSAVGTDPIADEAEVRVGARPYPDLLAELERMRDLGGPNAPLPPERVVASAENARELEPLEALGISVEVSPWMPPGVALMVRRPTHRELMDAPGNGYPWIGVLTGLGGGS